MTGVAKYPLDEVFKLIRASKYWFSTPSRSVNEVVKVYATTKTPKSNVEAEKYILDGLFALKDANFFKSSRQWDMTVDIYGLILDTHPWFVKFAIADEENDAGVSEPWLQEISFHPPDQAFKTVGGISIPSPITTGGSTP